jgi:hypothetical protein
MTMTILIAWASLSVGAVIGAMWKSLCETQSQPRPDIDAIMKLPRLSSEPDNWRRARVQVAGGRKRSA